MNFGDDIDELIRTTFEKTEKIISGIDGGWEFMKTFTPSDEEGFMFSKHPILTKIYEESERQRIGHSGASWGMTMRAMQVIACI